MFGFRKLRNNPRRRRPAAKINGPESLETRELMTVTASVNAAGLLSVRGSEMPDRITVFQISGNFFVQSLDAANVPTNRNMGSGVTSLDIRTFGGNDSVTNLTNLKATILTGNGDDTVVGGSNEDLIYTEEPELIDSSVRTEMTISWEMTGL